MYIYVRRITADIAASSTSTWGAVYFSGAGNNSLKRFVFERALMYGLGYLYPYVDLKSISLYDALNPLNVILTFSLTTSMFIVRLDYNLEE